MRTAHILAGATALALAGLASAPGAYAAADNGVDVVNTETVQVYVNPDGDIASKRVYEQLTLTGNGPVELSNPIEQDGLRNLDGFSGLSVEDGVQDVDLDVDGSAQLRSVSTYTGELPLDISIEYRLDGNRIEPSDVVGADGRLEVLYTVKNITAQPLEVSFPDGQGGETTETVDVPIPIVGSLTTVAPSNFTDVQSDQANMAGDGKGATKLSFTMTLFPPIGSDTAEFGYSATVKDGVVPSSSVSALPVNPMESPTFKTAADSYQGGSDTGVQLADGATTIDTNLLKLRDGAAKLLAGLIKLSDGADQLNAGLAGEAAPGARKLADGAGELNAGLGKIDDGAGQLADGAGRLSDGTGKLDDGANRLADGLSEAGAKAPALLDGLKQVRAGLVKIDKGLVELSSTLGPKAKASGGYQRLTGGVQLMISSIGSTSQPGNTLLYGLDQLRTKLTEEAVPGIEQMLGGTTCAAFTLEMLWTGTFVEQHPCFQALDPQAQAAIKAGLLGGAETNPVKALILQGLAHSIDGEGTEDDPTLRFGLNTLLTNLKRVSATDPGAIQALELLECGVSNASLPSVCDPDRLGLLQGLLGVQAGIPQLVDGIAASVSQAVGDADDTAVDETFRGGVNDLVDGVDRLSAGGDDLLAGLGLLADGAGRLSDGTGQLDAGTGELSAGADKLAAGTGDASEGSQRLADGAGTLADGLDEAADGSGRLSDGMAEAADGAPQLVDGAGRLSDEGMSQLIAAGEDTAQDYGKLYATIAAGAERADAEKMAYGAPEGAQGLTAYSYELLGDDGETGRNTKRGLAAMGLLGLGAGAFLLRRRLV